jgi:hypothetical protein
MLQETEKVRGDRGLLKEDAAPNGSYSEAFRLNAGPNGSFRSNGAKWSPLTGGITDIARSEENLRC